MQGCPTHAQFLHLHPTVSPKLADYLRASLSANSKRAYQSDINQFVAWGGSIPASPELVANYLVAHAAHQRPTTLARHLVSIGKAHDALGYASPIKSALVKSTLRGIRHIHGSAKRQVAPAIKEEVLSMVAGLSGLKGLRDKALLLIGFAGAFRRSELVGLSVNDIETAKQGIVLHLRFSKTDQAGDGRSVAIPYARGVVCPVLALNQWLDASAISDGPIFRGIGRQGSLTEKALTPQTVALIVKARAKAAGLDPEKYSGHSLRAGLVTSAAQAGVTNWKIRQQTGHRTDAMVAQYIRDANLFVNNAAGAVF